jgi:hypothetical protein
VCTLACVGFNFATLLEFAIVSIGMGAAAHKKKMAMLAKEAEEAAAASIESAERADEKAAGKAAEDVTSATRSGEVHVRVAQLTANVTAAVVRPWRGRCDLSPRALEHLSQLVHLDVLFLWLFPLAYMIFVIVMRASISNYSVSPTCEQLYGGISTSLTNVLGG